jgi:hypothetical protein
METHNAKGVPFNGRDAMRTGWDTKANPWPKDSWERMRWLAEWWFENADCFKSHIEAAAFQPIRLDVPASLHPDAPVSSVFPRFLFAGTHAVATFIMEDGQPGPVACLTGDDHQERGRAIVRSVMSAGLTMTAASKLVARLAELEDENRALKASAPTPAPADHVNLYGWRNKWHPQYASLAHAISAASQDLIVSADLVRNKTVGKRLQEHADLLGRIASDLIGNTNPAPSDHVRGISDEDRNYLEEVADGAWGDDPRTRGLARDRLKSLDTETDAPRLTSGERFLLEWLAKEDSSALGECEGADLAHLEQMALVVIQPVEGKHRHYSRVSVTEPGLAALAASEGGRDE